MSKAITGAVELAVGATMMATGVGGAFGWSLVLAGASSEFAAIAQKLEGNRGNAITVRQAAAPRRVIYGTQRVGAVEVFESTTGSSKDQYNMVLVFAAHEITNFVNLYLDGRQVYWHGSGGGWSVRNGIGYGGGADGLQHTAPDGSNYTFANASSGHRGVWSEARYGDQAAGDYLTSLHNNDSRWGPDSGGDTPSLMGCSYIYLKCEYNTNDFPQKPDARMTIKGKPVYDPRTGTTAYSENWALIVADIITNSDYGLGDAVNTDQLIAAANICDESVAFSGAGGGTEARYTCHYTWTMDKSVGEVLSDVMSAAAGRMSYIEGEWYIFPGTYLAPTASFTSDSLITKPTWSAQRKFREKVNSVQGTYIAPNYPYSVAGDLYDANGWYNNTTQDNFPFAFTPTSYPTFACDTLHGYSSDQFLTEDLGIELPLTLDFPATLSITQAQRVAKMTLLRNRQQGSGTLVMGAEALVLQPNDTFLFTMPQRGWTDKLLEVQRMDFSLKTNEDGVPQIEVQVSVNETDSSVYVWNSTDELTPYDVQAAPYPPGTYTTEPPTNVVLVSSAATAIQQPDGTIVPRIEITWDTPADIRVDSIQIQYQLVGVTAWSDGGTVSVASNIAYVSAIAGQQYDVRIRSLRSSGGFSDWVEIDGFTASLLLSVGTQDGVGLGSLVGEAYTTGTAAIICNPFTAQYGSNFVSIFPSGAVTLTTDGTIGGSGAAISQQTLYYVYYSDPTYTGGNVTPVATTNKSDFIGKLGYFLIDSLVTPYASSAAGTRYYPSTFSDVGTRTTQTPDSAYDNNLTTYAGVSGSANSTWLPGIGAAPGTTEDTTASGDCTWSGFPVVTSTAALNLYVVLAATSRLTGGASAGTVTVTATVNGTVTRMTTFTGGTSQTTLNVAVPSGTDLSTVQLEVTADPGGATATSTTRAAVSTITAEVYEIYIQT